MADAETQPNLPRRLAAEAIGSFFLFAAVVGSGIMGEALSGGNDAIGAVEFPQLLHCFDVASLVTAYHFGGHRVGDLLRGVRGDPFE